MGWFAELFEGEVKFTDYESDPSWWRQTKKLPTKKEGIDHEVVEVPTLGADPEVPHTPKEVTPKQKAKEPEEKKGEESEVKEPEVKPKKVEAKKPKEKKPEEKKEEKPPASEKDEKKESA